MVAGGNPTPEGVFALAANDADTRALKARIAAHQSWANTTDRTARTAPARAGLRAKFARQVDPDGTLSPAEREVRTDHLVRAHMTRLSMKAKAARSAAKGGGSDV